MLKSFSVALLALGCTVGVSINVHGESGRLLGASKCTYGPSYWCDNIRKSSECKATKYCINGDWSSLSLPADADDVCKICMDMVKQARDTLQSNQTEEELKEVLEGSCNLIPVKVIAHECDVLVDDFIPELVEVLSSEMNPQVVCHTAGLCNSERVDKLLEQHQQTEVKTPEDDTCSVCQKETDLMKDHVSQAGLHQLLLNILPLCRELGSYSDACAADMADNVAVIHDLIDRIDSHGLCQVSNLCTGFHQSVETAVLDVTSPAIDCDLCIHIVKHWRDILVSNTTREEFKQILDGICEKTAYKDRCTYLVDHYYTIVYDFLVNDLNAHAICKAVGVCSRPPQEQSPPLWINKAVDSTTTVAASSDLPESVPFTKLVRPLVTEHDINTPTLHHVKLHKSPNRYFGNDGIAHSNPLDDGQFSAETQQLPLSRMHLPDYSDIFRPNAELCAICEFGLEELQKVLLNDSTEDEITHEVEHLCVRLPHSISKLCTHYVDTYGQFLITLLAQQLNADQICPALGVCPAPSVDTELEQSPPGGGSVAAPHTPTCVICEYAMHELLKYLQEHKTAEEIRDGLDKLCDEILPHSVQHECEEFVNTFAEQIIDMVVSGMTADAVCDAIHLCLPVADEDTNKLRQSNLAFMGFGHVLMGAPSFTPIKQQNVWPSVDSSLCVLCKFAVDQIKEQLDDKKTDEEILSEVRSLCRYTPHLVRADCVQFVDDYGPGLIDEVKSEVNDPDQVCRAVHMCDQESAVLPGAELMQPDAVENL